MQECGEGVDNRLVAHDVAVRRQAVVEPERVANDVDGAPDERIAVRFRREGVRLDRSRGGPRLSLRWTIGEPSYAYVGEQHRSVFPRSSSNYYVRRPNELEHRIPLLEALESLLGIELRGDVRREAGDCVVEVRPVARRTLVWELRGAFAGEAER